MMRGMELQGIRRCGWNRWLGTLIVVLGLVLVCGVAGVAEPIPVTVTIMDTFSDPDTFPCIGGTGICPEPSFVGQRYAVEFQVVSDTQTDSIGVYGTITVNDGEENTCSRTVNSGDWPRGWSWYCYLTSTSAGTKTITATFEPEDPDTFGTGSDTEVHMVMIKPDTTLDITSVAPEPSVVGESYTVSGTVTATTGGTPTGTVTVDDGEGHTCAANVESDGSWGPCTLTSTSVGSKTLTAVYEGDENFNGSSDTETHTVDPADTTIVITAHTPETSVVGEGFEVFWSVTVNSPGSGTPTGDVTVNADKTPPDSSFEASCSASAENGSCTLTLDTSDGPGTYQLTAEYAGDTNFNSSTTIGAVNHVVNRADTSVTISTNSPDPSVVGESYAVGGTVTANAPGSGTPTGQVTVSDGENTCTVALSGTWSCDNMTSTTAGPKTLTVSYAGDSNFNAATTTIGHDVNKRTTSTALTRSPATYDNIIDGYYYVGRPVTLTADVSDESGVAGSPNFLGTVTWNATLPDSSVVGIGTSSVDSNGVCNIVYAPESVGTHQISALYEGDDNYESSSNDTTPDGILVGERPTSIAVSGQGSACVGEPVSLTAQVSDTSAVEGSPDFSGTVTWKATLSGGSCATGTFEPDGGTSCGEYCTGDPRPCGTCTVNALGECSVTYTPGAGDVDDGPVTITAEYSGDTNYETSSDDSHSITVTPRSLLVELTCHPATVYINETTNVTVTVIDVGCGNSVDPTGTVSIVLDDTGSTGQEGTVSGTPSYSSGGGILTCTGLAYTPTRNDSADDESHTLKATFTGSDDFDGITATGTFPLDVNKREVKVTLAPTVSAAFVDQVVQVDVTLQDDTPGTSPCCVVFSMPELPNAVITLDDLSSSGGFDSSDTGTFTEQGPVDYELTVYDTPWGKCTFDFYYKPTAGGTGTTTLQVTYPGNELYKSASGSTTLTVETRPTTTSVTCDPAAVFVDQRSTITIEVTDVGLAASALYPEGVLYLNTSGDGNFYAAIASTTPITEKDLVTADAGSVDVYYEAETAAASREDHVLKADYVATGSPADATTQVHEDSSGTASLTVKLRKTKVWISPGAVLPYSTGTMSSGITATVTDVTAEGESSSPGGTLTLEAPSGGGKTAGTIDVTGTTPSGATIGGDITSKVTVTWSGFVAGGTEVSAAATYDLVEKLQIAHPIIGTFVPNDGKHLASGYGTNDDDGTLIEVNIGQDSYPVGPPPGGTESDGTGEVISCGLIGGTTANDLFNFGTMHQTYVVLMEFMDIAATIIQLLPDVLVDVTDPAWSIIHTAFQGLVLDLDGDGILGAYELMYVWDIAAGGPITDFTPDSDGDGIDDGDEIGLAGGQYYPTILDESYSWSRPNPTHPDSDRDGISDGDEYYTFLTNCCDPDTDDDGLTDGQEVATWAAFNPTGYQSATLPSTTTDVREQLDPWVQDTDGDGISDYIEYYVTHSPCPFGNDPDSDGDGLIDGYEDKNLDGCWGDHDPAKDPGDPDYCTGGITPGTSTSQASKTIGWWETDLCDPDTDDDDLSDGEEEGLFGTGQVTPKDVSETVGEEGPDLGVTVPALDSDMDNDGLTDYDEVNVYQTNPMDADSDNDTVSDYDEVNSWTRDDSRDHSDPLMADTDGDGLTDDQEFTVGCSCGGDSPGTDGFVNDDDSDDDGLQDGREYELFGAGTDLLSSTGNGNVVQNGELDDDDDCCLCDPDSDGDGLSDGEEVHIGTLPLNWDSDNDGLSDREELQVYFTNPNDPDTDGDTASGILPYRPEECALDGYTGDTSTITVEGQDVTVYKTAGFDEGIGLKSDGEEALSRTGVAPFGFLGDQSDPLSKDTDGDGIQDDIEFKPGCNCPNVPGGSNEDGFVNDSDSDDDGLQDGSDTSADVAESNGNDGELDDDDTCSLCDPDSDGDGLSDGEEIHTGTDPLDWDSDDDGLSDREELQTYFTDPNDSDTDDDEADGNITARDPEATPLLKTDPTDTETTHSNNGAIAALSDCEEALSWSTQGIFTGEKRDESDPLQVDTDGDGIDDDREFTPGCPFVNDADSDDDGLQDGYEDDDNDGVVDPTDRDGLWNNYTLPANGSTGQGTGETNPCDPDTDDDGLSDGEEAGLFVPVGGTGSMVVPTTAGDTVPALDDDSDNDGLSDYEEVNITETNALDADTDDDTITDANELIAATGTTWPKRDFDQESNPLDIDTDDDGLTDNIEWDGSGLGITRVPGGTRDLVCPYVNDDDSDADGLQDGVEDANHDGVWGHKLTSTVPTIGDFANQAAPATGDNYYETNLCVADTDGDGLLDGEEVTLIGGGPVLGRPATWPANQPPPGFDPVTREAVSTVLPVGPDYTGGPNPNPLYTFAPAAGNQIDPTIPALDVDSDNDGLSDYEEVNITGTDPLDADSDNDTIMDADELIATGGLEDTPGNPGVGPRRTFDQNSDPLDINTDDDYLFDPVEGTCAEPIYLGTGLSALAGQTGGTRDPECPYVNNADSDDDGLQDGLVVYVNPQTSIPYDYFYTHFEAFRDVTAYTGPLGIDSPGFAKVTVEPPTDGEQYDDLICNVCDADSDGDGLLDGEEVSIGTNPDDWDTDDDGRSDWHEHTGGGPIPTDPFDPDTDDDGLLDSAEVFGSNNTNPANADTDGDGLCDGGAGTPWMTSNDARIVVNPICKSCAVPGLGDCGATGGVRTGSVDGIGDHPNPHGYGEDKNGNGTWDGSIGDKWQSGEDGTPETDPNQYDTDGDGDGDGVEVLGFSTSRQHMIPPADIFGRPITVVYPACGCLEPLILDTDGDGLTDGYEDRNHDGNFDFLPSEFDHQDPLPGPPIPYPTETNPCDPDTDHDELTDWEERYQRQPLLAYPDLPIDNDGDGLIDEDPVDGIDNDLDGLVDEDPAEGPIELTFNPTNPLDHDTDNDRIYDGPEVYWVCVAVTYSQLDNDGDALIDEDPIDGLDNDGDGLFDEDPVDFFVRFVPMLDPTNRDSDSDGWIDGLDDDPCNSELIPILQPVQIEPIDSDGDGFADDDELVAGTHPNDPEDHPTAYCMVDLDFDQEIDDRMWLEPSVCCGIANSVAIDIDSNVLIDARLQIVQPRDVKKGDFDGDGAEDDYRYVVEYAFSNYRVLQPRIVATIDDYNGDLTIDHAEVVRK